MKYILSLAGVWNNFRLRCTVYNYMVVDKSDNLFVTVSFRVTKLKNHDV